MSAQNPSPQEACHRLLTALGGGGAPSSDSARRVEVIIEMLEQHTVDELLEIAEFLSKTRDAKDRGAAFAVAKAEVAKLPTKEAAAEAEAEVGGKLAAKIPKGSPGG